MVDLYNDPPQRPDTRVNYQTPAARNVRSLFFFRTTGDIVFVYTYPGSLRLVWKDARVRGLSAPPSPHDRRLYVLADNTKYRSP